MNATQQVPSLRDVTLKIRGYKCFGDTDQGFETVLPINLIIGRNNSGKSSLLDLVHYATDPFDLKPLAHKGKSPQVILSHLLSEQELRPVFPDNMLGGEVGGNYWEFGKKWIGKRLTWELQASKKHTFVSLDPPLKFQHGGERAFNESLAGTKRNPFQGIAFKRLMANRDVVPEADLDSASVNENGDGATDVIQKFINKASLPRELVEQVVLADLNKIFEPDAKFTRILVQQLADKRWEIYLEEPTKGRVALTHTGSGLKTILLVLIFLHLLPHLENKPLGKYLFGFEELENNLHPALLRRLLIYLRNKAVEEHFAVFLTTHSNTAIDLFSRDENAQIIHVTHNLETATVKSTKTYIENKGILDDLDVRASDLLQSNGVIWVEGPSDRLYVNRWIELWSKGALKEGVHYQCVFYGGRLLAHLSAAAPEAGTRDEIEILRVNRNAAVLIDSDRTHDADDLNATKSRIVDEISAISGMPWVTAGREVENYLPLQAIQSFYSNTTIGGAGQYDDFAECLDKVANNEGKRFLGQKVEYAAKICPHITEEGLKQTLDLASKLTELCRHVHSWNGSVQ